MKNHFGKLSFICLLSIIVITSCSLVACSGKDSGADDNSSTVSQVEPSGSESGISGQGASDTQIETGDDGSSDPESGINEQDEYQTPLVDMPPILSISDNNKIYSSGDMRVSLLTLGQTIEEITINAAIVPIQRYSYDGETLTISGEYLKTFEGKENYRLKVTTTGGSAEAYFTINDRPVITLKTDFIKYPGESIVGESFKSYVSNKIGKLTYSYELAKGYEGKGALTDNLNGTFNFTPSGVFYGDIGIVFSAVDEYGAFASEEFTLTYKRIDPVIYDADKMTFEKSSDTENVVFTVDTFGKEKNKELYFEMTDILLGNESIGNGSYILKANDDKRKFALKASYLLTQPIGKRKFTLTTTAGSAEFFVKITDSGAITVDKTSVTFIKGDESDIKITVNPSNNEVTVDSFTIEGVDLSDGDLTYENQVLTIGNAFLTGLDAGVYKLSVKGEEKVKLTIAEKEPVLPTVSAENGGYLIDECNDVAFVVGLNGNTFSGLYYGDELLTEGDDYDFDGDRLVIGSEKLISIYRFGKDEYTFRLDVEENGGKEFNVLFENAENRILNGGFETGDLYGWNAYQIWNNKEKYMAWTKDRVVSGGYFSKDYSYDRDGDYNLGIYGGSIDKDSGQARMGHLRSADFTLGGSGYISFKLGGGKNPQFAYVSVRRAADNVEIARFGNKNFDNVDLIENNSADGKDKNAEAYLFRYYYDLSAYIGERLYFVISDVSSDHWCVLSADSFYTYYPEAPTFSNSYLAENILPTVLGIGKAGNEIKGGNPFSENTFADCWVIDGNGWGRDGESAKSNVIGGNSGMGILRSATFTIDGENEYLRFNFAGTRYYERTIFVSVKEANTNIEVKRFYLRSELKGGEGSGTENYDNHMCDIHDLDKGKEYYLEFSDNENRSWGVFLVKEVRLCNEQKWNEKPTGDRAQSVTGLITDYTYVLLYND